MNKKQERDKEIYVWLVSDWQNCHKKKKKNKKKRKKLTDIERKYKSYKYGAKSRGHDFELSIKQFEEYWQQPCSYCGDEIETIGLDRVDNKQGYNIENIVPCCFPCNRMKGTMDRDDFIGRCDKIANRGSKK